MRGPSTADPVGRLPSRWPTYLLLVGSVAGILAAGLTVPMALGHPVGAAAPGATSTTTTAVPPGPVRDHDDRPPPPYADLTLVTSPPPPPGTTLVASDVGVTPATVTVGIILPGLGAISAFGIDVSQLDPKVQQSYWDAAIARVNAAGGVDGRRLQLAFAVGDITSQDSMRAACRSLTEDHRVFAVANVLGVTGDPILCVTRDHATPYIGIDGDDPSYYQISQGRLVTLEPSSARTLATFFGRLTDMGLIKGKRIGIVHGTGPGGIDGAAVRTALLARGAKAVIDGPLGMQDPLIVSAEVAAAERRMHQGGADTVVLLTNAVYGTVFAAVADQDRYTPTYLMSDLGDATAGDSFVSNMPASFFHHALAVTSTEIGRGRSGLPESSLDAGCRLHFQQAIGHTIGRDGADAVAALASCAVVQLLTMGLTGAGPNPTRSAFSAALGRTGAFALPGFGRGVLGPGRLDAADQVSVVSAHADCQCFVAIDGVQSGAAVAALGSSVMLAAVTVTADIAVHGLILGLVYGVLAAGLVLVYRASGVVNFAHGETGAFGAAVLAKLVLDEHWPWAVAVPAVLILGGAIGAVTEVVIARRVAHRPRLALLVATIGLAQLLLVADLLLPKIKEVAPYPSPLHRELTIGSVVLSGPDFLAIAAVPAIVVGLAVWLARTPSGRALRAASDNPDAARLAGIRPGRVALLAWTLAGVVSTATAVLANPLQGVVVGQQTEAVGAGLLVRALAAALVGRLESLPLALAGGVGVGIVQAAADAGKIDPAVVDVVLLVAVLVLVLIRPSRREQGSGSGEGEGELVTVPPVRRGRVVGWSPRRAAAAALVLAAVLLPLVAGRSSQLFLLSRMGLYAIVGLSVVVLTGWAGQLSLGQFAVVGVGTFGAAVLERHGMPFWFTVPIAGAIGAGVSLLVGVPALRARGLDLAVTTLAFAVACSSWLFTRSWLLGPGGVAFVSRGRLLGVDVSGPVAYYEVCLAVLGLALLGVAALRRADLGRALLAVRSNERRAAAGGVSPAATKLAAFALSGALAGAAGALLGGLRIRSGPADFGPKESLQVVALAVIGGAGSAVGAVVGAVFVLGVPAMFGDTTVAGLLPSGIGLLVLVLAFPGGLVEVAGRLASRLPRRRGAAGARPVAPDGPEPGSRPDTPEPGARPDPDPDTAGARPDPDPDTAGPRARPDSDTAGARSAAAEQRSRPGHAASLEATGLTVRFGGRLALDAVDLSAAAGEIVGLIGANGAGKSTLLDVVSGFITPAQGQVRMGGRDLRRLSPAARARAGLGRVLQDARLFEDLTLAEAVLVTTQGRRDLAAQGRRDLAAHGRRDLADAMLTMLGLSPWADEPCQRLSTGTRRLAELACALAAGPSVVLLDEPTAGLAQREAEEFGSLLRRLRHELDTTVILVEHDVSLVLAVADHVVCLGAGRVLAAGAPGDVVAEPAVIESFLGGGPQAVGRPGPTGGT